MWPTLPASQWGGVFTFIIQAAKRDKKTYSGKPHGDASVTLLTFGT